MNMRHHPWLVEQPYLSHFNPNHDKLGRFASSGSASSIHLRAKLKEPRISRDVSTAINSSGAKMYGMEHRLKTKKSISRKVNLGKDIKDAVRYTAILSEKDFIKQYNGVKRNLENKGYSETRCKNYFEDYKKGLVNHKSVQSNFKTPDGYEFEIQFHTASSQKAKDKKVPLYEEARNPNTNRKRAEELAKQMRLLAEGINDPVDIYKIKSH